MSTMLKSTEVGHFGPKFRGVPLEVDPSCWGLWRVNIPGWLTDSDIIVEEFQPMFSQSTNVTDGQTDGQTDRRHAFARPRFAISCKFVKIVFVYLTKISAFASY